MDREKKIKALSALGIGKLKIKNEEELTDILGIIEALFQNAIPAILSGAEEKEEVTAKFRRRLNIIKKATTGEGV